MTFEEFKKLTYEMPSIKLVQLCLLDSFPFCFQSNQELYNILRSEVCFKFNIHERDFAIVGSAQTGFSLNPKNLGRPYSDASDIDIILVSDELFQKIWIDLLDYRKKSYASLDPRYRKNFSKLQYILFFGILRLDKLSNEFDFAKKWWEFFNRLSIDKRFGPRRIRAALFKSWKHVNYYYARNFEEIKERYNNESACNKSDYPVVLPET